MDRVGASLKRVLDRELRHSRRRGLTSPSRSLLDEASRDAREREAAYAAWLDLRMPEIAEELTQELIPADLRAAGVRFAWAEESS